MDLEWNEQLSIGNETIDSDHKKLISMVNGVKRGIRAGDNRALAQVLEQLENWLRFHFTKEEKIAQAVNSPLDQHKLAQQYDLKELQYIRDELVSRDFWSDGAVKHFCLSMENWAIDHITRMDMQMKSTTQARPYYFMPGDARL